MLSGRHRCCRAVQGTVLHQLYAVKLYGSSVRDGTSRCVRLLLLIVKAFLVVMTIKLNVTIDGIETTVLNTNVFIQLPFGVETSPVAQLSALF